ncbi:LamG domain-containing protein, partial [Candidatus Woesearchaeota archaeon]|nr:LamG domain-containing protein [Candidatus Woesearchaeota archaeon]
MNHTRQVWETGKFLFAAIALMFIGLALITGKMTGFAVIDESANTRFENITNQTQIFESTNTSEVLTANITNNVINETNETNNIIEFENITSETDSIIPNTINETNNTFLNLSEITLENSSKTYTTINEQTINLSVTERQEKRANEVGVMSGNTPTVSNLVLTSSSDSNTSEENITGTWAVNDQEGDPVYNITNWYVDGASITVLNLAFENNTPNILNSTKDHSGNKNGTISNLTWNPTGGYTGGAYYFPADTDYRIDFDSGVAPLGEKTIEFRIKTGSTALMAPLVNSDSGTNGYGDYFRIENGKAIYRHSNRVSGIYNINIQSTTSINDNVWHHVLATWDGTTNTNGAKLYIDGVLEAQGTANGIETEEPTNNLSIGYILYNAAYYHPLDGYIDDIRIYDRALSADQIIILNNSKDVLVSNETDAGEVIQFCVTPNDGTQDGSEVCSSLEIQPPPPLTLIDTPGTYTLDYDYKLASQSVGGFHPITNAFLVISSDDVDYNCQGHTITNDFTAAAGGIIINSSFLAQFNNITIRNCDLRGYDYGIYALEPTNILLDNITSTNNDIGISIPRNNPSFTNENVRIINSHAEHSTTCFETYQVQQAIIENVTGDNCTSSGIRIWGQYINTTNATITNSGKGYFIDTPPFSSGISGSFRVSSSNFSNNNQGIYSRGDFSMGMQINWMTIINTTASHNNVSLYMFFNQNPTIINSDFHSSTYGVWVDETTNINTDRMRIFNNSYDLYIDNEYDPFFDNPHSVNINALILPPTGSLTSYTNVTVVDSVAVNETYILNWTSITTEPGDRNTFNNKNLEIKNISKTTAIDYVQWRWTEAETVGFNENNLELWVNNATGWHLLNNTPDTSSNTLALYNLIPSSKYSIMSAPYSTPTVTNILLDTTLGTNTSAENLTLHYDSGNYKNITNWYLENNNIIIVNMPFENNSAISSGIVQDYSGYENNGTTSNNPNYQINGGHDGWGAYDFAGSGSQAINITDSPSTRPQNISVEAWIYPDTLTAYDTVAMKSSSSSWADGWGLANHNLANEMYFHTNSYTACLAGTSMTPGSWYHVVGTYDGSTAKIYVNGTLAGTDSTGCTPISYVATPTVIGKGAAGDYTFDGRIDDFRIYNRTLGPDQILSLYENGQDIIVPQETRSLQRWSASVIPNDGFNDGLINFSNNITLYAVEPSINSVTSEPVTPSPVDEIIITIGVNYGDPGVLIECNISGDITNSQS